MNSQKSQWSLSNEKVKTMIANLKEDQLCPGYHQFSCLQKSFRQFGRTFQSTFKLYLVLHLVQTLLSLIKTDDQKQQVIQRSFKNKFLKFIKKLSMSLIFACSYATINYSGICIALKIYKNSRSKYIINKPENNILSSFIAGVSLLAQSHGRQQQISLFALNKSIETTYHLLRRRQIPIKIQGGQYLVMAISCSIISFLHFRGEQIKEYYQRIMNYLLQQR